MTRQYVQVAWSEVVCIQTELIYWQNVIPYGRTKRDNVVITTLHG